MEVLPVDKDAMFLLSTFKFSYYSVLFSKGDMLEDHQVSPCGQLGTMPCKHCFQEHHHQQMQELDLSSVIHGDDIKHC